MELTTIHHFALSVADLDTSIEWYQDKLSFILERRFSPAVDIEIAHMLSQGGVRIELLFQAGSAPSPDEGKDPLAAIGTRGAKHIGFLVDDVDAVARTLQARGVELVLGPVEVPPAGVKNLFILDNSGNQLKFDQWLDSAQLG